jgi:hypothetical protein
MFISTGDRGGAIDLSPIVDKIAEQSHPLAHPHFNIEPLNIPVVDQCDLTFVITTVSSISAPIIRETSV